MDPDPKTITSGIIKPGKSSAMEAVIERPEVKITKSNGYANTNDQDSASDNSSVNRASIKEDDTEANGVFMMDNITPRPKPITDTKARVTTGRSIDNTLYVEEDRYDNDNTNTDDTSNSATVVNYAAMKEDSDDIGDMTPGNHDVRESVKRIVQFSVVGQEYFEGQNII